MISAIELKKYVANAGILGIVIDKLCHRKKLCPIILFKVDKDSEINFYYTILPLSLAVCLQVEGGRKFLLDVKEII